MTRQAWAVCLLVAGGVVTAASAEEAAHNVRLHTGPERSGVHGLFGPRLAEALAPKLNVELAQSSGSIANLETVLNSPEDVAFAQLDLYRRFLVDNPEAADRLEFYGDLPVCVLAVARVGSPWMLASAELPDELVLKSFDIGPAEGDAAVSLAPLTTSAPRLAGATIEHRGGSRALARVRRRDTELAIFVEYPSGQTPLIEDVLNNDGIDFITSIASVLKGAQIEDGMTFLPTELQLPQPGYFDSDRAIRTVCTSVGIVINADGDRDVIESVVHAVMGGVLVNSDSWWSFDSVSRIAGRLWRGAKDLFAEFLEWI